MSDIDEAPDYERCQVCKRMGDDFVPCETSGYARICDSCVTDHALDGCAACKERVAEEAEQWQYDRYERNGP